MPIVDNTFVFRGNIVVFENDADEMYRISEALKEKEFRPFGVAEREEFFEVVSKHSPVCAIIDATMGIEGLKTFVDQLRSVEEGRKLPVLALILSESDREAAESLSNGVVRKPSSPEAIVVSVESLIASVG